MSYQSEVAFITHTKIFEDMQSKHKELIDNAVLQSWDNYTIAKWDCITWNDMDDPEIVTFMTDMHKLDRDSYLFMRLGEESGDSEEYGLLQCPLSLGEVRTLRVYVGFKPL